MATKPAYFSSGAFGTMGAIAKDDFSEHRCLSDNGFRSGQASAQDAHPIGQQTTVSRIVDVGFRTLNPAPDEAFFRYFTINVHKDSDTLWVNSHEVDRAGWYTFRFEFAEEDGHVTVLFELADRGRVLFAEPVTITAYSGEPTTSLSTADFGTGYIWFVTLSEGLELPIDHRMYRPGK